jgi:chromosome segregation ATPase
LQREHRQGSEQCHHLERRLKSQEEYYVAALEAAHQTLAGRLAEQAEVFELERSQYRHQFNKAEDDFIEYERILGDYAEELDFHKHELDGVERSLAQCTQELESFRLLLQNTMRDFTAQSELLQCTRSDLATAQLQAECSAGAVHTLTERVAQLESELGEQQFRVNTLSTENGTLRVKLDNAEKLKRQADVSVVGLLHSVAGLKDRLRETGDTRRQLQAQLQDAKAFKAKFYFLQQVSANRERELEDDAARREAETGMLRAELDAARAREGEVGALQASNAILSARLVGQERELSDKIKLLERKLEDERATKVSTAKATRGSPFAHVLLPMFPSSVILRRSVV